MMYEMTKQMGIFRKRSIRLLTLVLLFSWIMSVSHTNAQQQRGPVAAFTVSSGNNVALHEDGANIVAYSSVYGPATSYQPKNAIDSNPNTFWYTGNRQTTDQWITIELTGDTMPVINRVVIQGSSSTTGIQNFEIRVSTTDTDNAAFTTVLTGVVPQENAPYECTFEPIHARYVQLVVLNNWGNSRYTRVGHVQVLTRDRQGGIVSFPPNPSDAIAGYSSQQSSFYAPEHALDTSTQTIWHTASGATTDQWVNVRLIDGSPYLVDRVLLQASSKTTAPNHFQIRISNDSTDDTDFVTVLEATLPQDGLAHWYTFPAIPARYVQLLIQDNHGASSFIEVQTFQVYSPQVGGPTVALDDLSTSPDGEVVAWNWDFGDGTQSTMQHPMHTYKEPGTYSIRLTVTDNGGNTHTDTMNYTVFMPPIVEMTWTPEEISEGQQVTFNASIINAPGSASVYGEWQFSGTKIPFTEEEIQYTFSDNGTFPVALLLTNNHLLTTVVQETIPVHNTPPTVHNGADQTIVWGEYWSMGDVSVSDAGTNDHYALTCTWDFGDGQTQQRENCTTSNVRIPHSYDIPGVYTPVIPSQVPILRSFMLEAFTATGEQVRQFSKPYTISVGYSSTDIETAGVQETALELAFFDEQLQTWVAIPGEVDTQTKRVVASLDHFTQFALSATETETTEIVEEDATTPTPIQSVEEAETSLPKLREEENQSNQRIYLPLVRK